MTLRPESTRIRDLLLAPTLSPPDIAAILSSFGFSDPSRADAELQRLSGPHPEERRALAEALPALLDDLSRAGAPDRGLSNLSRLAEQAASRIALFAALVQDGALRERACILLSQSQWLADALVREPRLLFWLGSAREAPAQDAIEVEIAAATWAQEDDDRRHAALARVKRRETLAIGHRDLVLGRALEETVRDLSRLADALAEAALEIARRTLAGRHPALARETLPFAIMALGKLGGEELNYSSDIDLVLLHDPTGFETGDLDLTPGGLFEKLGREVVRLLSRGGPDGALYRVDLRLRPGGSQGALVPSLDACAAYYEDLGRTWERQALLKARPIAGDRALGVRFLSLVEPFVFRRHLAIEAIAEIKALKRRIEERGAAQATRDVKEGPGGLRDIEFTVQFLQLLHGAELPEIRAPGTLPAIERLERADCVEADEASTLRSSYVFLRTVEHRLQMLSGLQTHVLPASADEVRDLARRLRYRGEDPAAELHADLDRHGAAARAVLDRVLHGLFPDAGSRDALARASELLLEADPPAAKVAGILGAAGFSDPAAALADLRRLASEKSRYLSASPRTRTYFASLLPRLLRAISETVDPQATLSRFERAASTLGAKAVFYQLLAEEPRPAPAGSPPPVRPLDVFVRLAADSPWLTGELERTPGLFDEVVDLLLTRARVSVDDVTARIEAARAIAGGNLEEALASVKRSTLLLVGIRELGERANVANVQDELTSLADACLRTIVLFCAKETEDRLGKPTAPRGSDGRGLAVLGLGKLGGREMGYGSDLDLLFAYERTGATDRGTAHGELFEREAQAVLSTFQRGGLYAVDPRLRPEGGHGALAQSFDSIAAYYESGRAASWERVAAMKLRAVAGDLEAGKRLVDRIHAACFAAPTASLPADLLAMRARQEEPFKERVDLKRSAGGIADIEFAVAAAKLLARGDPPAIRPPGVIPALHGLLRAGRLTREQYTDLVTGYQLLRQIESRVRLAEGRALSTLPDPGSPALRGLARRLGYVDTRRKTAEGALLAELEFQMRAVRRRFEEIVGPRPAC